MQVRREGPVDMVAVVMSGWPRVSETFAVNELLALRRHGRLARIFATKPGDDSLSRPDLVQPSTAGLDDIVEVLQPGSAERQGAAIAKRLIDLDLPVAGVHGYFAHHPAAVAERAARHLGVSFGFSTHALDARKVEQSELARRAHQAAVVITCNRPLAGRINELGVAANHRPHGVDLSAFTPSPGRRPGHARILGVGRLVEKKGFRHLIAAMSRVRRSATLTIVGDGPLRTPLSDTIRLGRLDGRVRLVGRSTHADLPALYRDADVVVVPSVVDATGDSDGLPNVVLEAMASGRPVIASRVSGIPDAIRAVGDGLDTGVLVPPGDEDALAAAINALLGAPMRQSRLSQQGRRYVSQNHDLVACGNDFVDLIRASYVRR